MMQKYSKKFIEETIKEKFPDAKKIFKTKKEDDYSLTQDGYIFLSTLKMYQDTFKAKVDDGDAVSMGALIIIKKLFDSPYFIKGKTIFYFDDVINAEVSLHGGFDKYVENIRKEERKK